MDTLYSICMYCTYVNKYIYIYTSRTHAASMCVFVYISPVHGYLVWDVSESKSFEVQLFHFRERQSTQFQLFLPMTRESHIP